MFGFNVFRFWRMKEKVHRAMDEDVGKMFVETDIGRRKRSLTDRIKSNKRTVLARLDLLQLGSYLVACLSAL